MAVEYMKPINIKKYQNYINTKKGFEYKGVILSSAGNGGSVLIPTQVQNIAVALVVGGSSTGKVQTTVSPLADVESDNAVWLDWDAGVVSTNTADVAKPVTAIRQVNVSGTTQLLMRAQ
jgi:hypothetical protein